MLDIYDKMGIAGLIFGLCFLVPVIVVMFCEIIRDFYKDLRDAYRGIVAKLEGNEK